MNKENIVKTLGIPEQNQYFAQCFGKKSVYTDKISMSGRSVLTCLHHFAKKGNSYYQCDKELQLSRFISGYVKVIYNVISFLG